MTRVIVIGSSPLLVEGVCTALRLVEDWEVREGRTEDDADAWVLVGEEIVVRGASGAVAQLAVHASPSRLRAALAAVLEGLSVRELPWLSSAPEHEPLTSRELEVFELLGKGLTNRDIAGVLGVSAHTAKYHVSQILAKLGVASRAEAVSEGLRSGLIGL